MDGKIACLAAYRLNALILPSSKQLVDARKTIDEVKKEIAVKWSRKYSNQTRAEIGKYLDKVGFFLPPSKGEFRDGFTQKVQREIQTRKRNSNANVKDMETFAFFNLMGPFVDGILLKQEEENDDRDYKGLCDNDKPLPLTDANYTLFGKIEVSYTSVHALDMGRGVLAHELGHGISNIFKNKNSSEESLNKHHKFLGCLVSRHPENGVRYMEEDYADWVSANITKSNMACLFPQMPSASISGLKNEWEIDPHSSEFFRLLHVESVQTGKLPEECNAFLVERKTPTDFLSCQNLLDDKK